MEPLLGVKIGCLLALLILTLLCGLIPIRCKWFQIHAATGRQRRVLSLLGCIAAGVFLGAGLMHMAAEALEGIETEIESYRLQDDYSQNGTDVGGSSSSTADPAEVHYPFGELVISLGFFLVFLLESLALQCCSRGAAAPEEIWGNPEAPSPCSHGPLPAPARGPLRALVLLLSLSLHSLFEGLAVGLQPTVLTTLQLCLAVLAHKGLVVFGVALQLVREGTGPRWALLCVLLLALMTPLGLALGLAVAGGPLGRTRMLTQAVLEGVAAGTFLYVTFLEVLPQALASPESALAKWCCVAGGFAFMAIVAVWA
ncbi:zinc transporter ZIP2 isoform X1 [Tachyglossus aculeatus]|uniref:zinc transporter ZIP2 isoform X1 n=2 Tax=Tachyglossus aculeatus TaxID=9261 RepID=UPI0018F3AB8C|nr:zinc transporter ZIP2 isoform X1 [Tachyglossus aculeatus]